MPVVIGIDPGATGGVVVMDLDGTVRGTGRMPVNKGKRPTLDLGLLERALDFTKNGVNVVKLVAVEQIRPQGNSNGVVGMFALAKQCGEIHGLCHAMRLLYVEVPPKEWQRLLVGVPHPRAPKGATEKEKAAARKAWKQEAMNAAARRWPKADLVGSVHHSATRHSGIADALWIAEFARLTVTGKTLATKEVAV